MRPSAAGTGRVYPGWFPRAGYGLEPCEDAIPDRKPGYLGFVFVSVVVVLPPSRSGSVFVWVSVLPAIPSRWTSFSITVLPFLSTSLWIVTSRWSRSGLGETVVVVCVPAPGTGTGGG